MDVQDSGDLLRAHGLRVTPQRRAILSAFAGGPTEHLSADEIHARAAAVIPEIGRGTVYSALAELTELGLLAAVGAPEPVRYESTTTPHQHFRCRLCVRLFDVELDEPPTDHLRAQGFAVERLTTTAEGVCAECRDYDAALTASAAEARSPPRGTLPSTGVAALRLDTPVGPLLLGATADGLIRVVFDDHGDAPALTDALHARRGGRAAREHLASGRAAVEAYFAHHPAGPCPIDWARLDDDPTLRAVAAIDPTRDVSYDTLRTPADAGERGHALGSNPLAIVVPCHRVTRGRQVPTAYVGGAERRLALRRLDAA
jgi:Fe2+ or Zn2+ uptake regulation protein/O6-methylguanine-DNA--protein-cysteine methyltransferase